MLRIAVPNKGSLSDPAAQMLTEAGYRQRTDSKDLALLDADNDVEFFYLRPRDIAVYVGEGTLDVGLTGRDLLLDSGTDAEEILGLGFGESTFHFAAPEALARQNVEADVGFESLAGRRVATAYPGLVEAYLSERGVAAQVVRLDGAVETAVRLGVADAIADVVSTGATLRQAGLAVFGEPILRSEAILICRPGSARAPGLSQLVRRLQGVLVARRYVMVAYDVPAAVVERACALTPGIESPTISPLRNPDWFAVSALVLKKETNRVMDDLWDLGARGILVTDISACRL
ncbi:MAG: ATP phosphoribosyltransferase [Geodermatophilaceae bacterium]|nr:ATP phosphoribosyltransferase [Geodermatophilaceae bacterium]